VNIPSDFLSTLWKPDLEVYGMEVFDRKRLLKPMSSIQITNNQYVEYEAQVDFTFSCQMNFDRYPLETHQCPFRIGSYYSTDETVNCTLKFEFNQTYQRSLQYFMKIEPLPEELSTFARTGIFDNKTFAVCGFTIHLARTRAQIFFQMYFNCILFTIVSWVSFVIKPENVPGRMGLLVTIFLVLINIFNGFKLNAPVSKNLNAMDVYMLMCIGQTFLALAEYSVLLFKDFYKTETLSQESINNRPINAIIQNVRIGKGDTGTTKYLTRNKLDLFSLIFFPIFFVLFNVVYWVIYI
jgi:hypothetical protein